MTYSRRAIEKAEDFAGLKLRVIQNPEGTNCQRRTTSRIVGDRQLPASYGRAVARARRDGLIVGGVAR